MNFKQLSPIEWDAQRFPFDFHIRLERDEYVVDVFDSGIDNSDDAYLTTHTCDTWQQVERYCREFDGTKVV
jgi:hypothetical protein